MFGPPLQSLSIDIQSRLKDRHKPFHIRPRHIVDPHPLPSQQFQDLFDSLFKVLFIFLSQYLFAIGLSPIFSLGRNSPLDWDAFPNNPIRHSASWCNSDRAQRVPHTLRRLVPGDLGPVRR